MTQEGIKYQPPGDYGDDDVENESGGGVAGDAMSTNLGDPHRLPENCVEYWLFVIGSGSQLDVRQTRQRLETIRKAAGQLCQTLTKDYIWQRDEFHVELENANGLFYLHGVTDYGDAVEDEWLVVYMLRELTKLHLDLWVRVADSDREFLLIEAANALPQWVSPETDHCRVWIHCAKLLIIPPDNKSKPSTSSSKASILSLPQAIDFLKSNANAIVHSASVQTEAFYRLEKYPEHISSSMHHALVTIPRKLAYILHSIPRTIAPAIECFYLRDPFTLKSVLSATGPWTFPPKDLVTVSVRFSKVLFAQLRSQRFETPPSWHSTFQTIPNGSDTNSRERDILDTGMKLTSGFEMLASRAEENKVRVVREMAILLDDLKEDGEETLPSNQEIGSWENVHRNDDESWLDINYEDFERELEGKGEQTQGSHQQKQNNQPRSGFGDSQTQENLRKIVSRFEEFLKDDDAGLDGAELDSEGSDDDQEEDEEDSDLEEDRGEVDFDEDAFARLIKEMMMGQRAVTSQNTTNALDKGKQRQIDDNNSSDNDHDEERAIQELSSQMEAELKGFGALRIDDRPAQKAAAIKSRAESHRAKGQQREEDPEDEKNQEEDNSDDDIDIDYNLAKNLLESFKSQGGMAGPAGNLMGLMGFQLPRDEDDENEKEL